MGNPTLFIFQNLLLKRAKRLENTFLRILDSRVLHYILPVRDIYTGFGRWERSTNHNIVPVSLAGMSCALADCKLKMFPEASGIPPVNYFTAVVNRYLNHGQPFPTIPAKPNFLKAINYFV